MTKTIFQRNPALIGFRSHVGGPLLPPSDYFAGSPEVRFEGAPTSVQAVYASLPGDPPGAGRMTGAASWLPFLTWPSLGEGGTPLINVTSSAPLASVRLKAEWMNPTSSHKDRMLPLAMARAVEVGARGVIGSSSGNAGISLAAYAARAGLPCRIVVTPRVPPLARRAMATYGAETIEVQESLARWQVIEKSVTEEQWYPVNNFSLPAVGNNPWGVEGYKSIAFELAADVGDGLDVVLVPTARGDLIWAICAGFAALAEAGHWRRKLPRLIAVEPFPRLTRVIAGLGHLTDLYEGSTLQASIAGATITHQALLAVQSSGGTAIVVQDREALAAQSALARQHGIYLELCSAGSYAAIPALLAAGALHPGEHAVVIATSAGFRDPPSVVPAAMESA